MIIVWLKEFKWNTRYHTYIPKMVWLKSLIKRIELIAEPLLHNCNLPSTCWGHIILHISSLIQLRPTAYHITFPLYIICGNAPIISHLWKLRCAVYVPILLPKHTSMTPIENWGSTWDITPHRLLSTWIHLLVIYLQSIMLILYVMRIISRH
jgi:hypothetical protein